MADERIAFLTGHLAEPRLRRLLENLNNPGFDWEVVNIGVKVAALMTEPIITRRLPRGLAANRVILPGRAGVDPQRLSAATGLAFERGPEELADLARYLGHGGGPPDLSRHDTRIFAEIVDAVTLSEAALLARAGAMREEGANVIDLGCKPGTAFPELEARIALLQAAGHRVSVDSGNVDELRRAAKAGADFVLSLTEHTLEVIDGTETIPVLIPAYHGDLESLIRAAAAAKARGIKALLDPIIDPIHFGFTAAIGRYAALRERLPDAEILMGTGNLTELTDADSSGVTAVLLGICSELAIRNVLVVQVSPHTRDTVAEHDAARRMMFAARANADLPRAYGERLLQAHDRAPFTTSVEEIARMAEEVRDRNFRIIVAPDGIHIFNGHLHEVVRNALDAFPRLGVETDGPHAFYLGTELMKAETAWRLGKRYTQDAPLDFGAAAPVTPREATKLAEAGHTLRARPHDDT